MFLVTLSLFHLATLPLFHLATLRLFHLVTLPLLHLVTLPLLHLVTLPVLSWDSSLVRCTEISANGKCEDVLPGGLKLWDHDGDGTIDHVEWQVWIGA